MHTLLLRGEQKMIKNIDDGTRRNRKEDIYWDYLFDEFDILNQINKFGTYVINAETFKNYCKPENISDTGIKKGSEARLMIKWDSSNKLPNIFKEHNITVLSTGDGKYTLGRLEVYNNLGVTENDLLTDIKEMSLPSFVTTLSPESITTEAQALNAADISGIFNDFLEETEIYQTLSGIYSSGKLNFTINDMKTDDRHDIEVIGTQVEIDASYESPENFYVIEGKNKLQSDYCIRQLFYPYRVALTKTHKPVYPVFFFHHKGIFNLSLYEVRNKKDYNSLRLLKRQNYKII